MTTGSAAESERRRTQTVLLREYTNYLSKQARLIESPKPTGADSGFVGLGTSSPKDLSNYPFIYRIRSRVKAIVQP